METDTGSEKFDVIIFGQKICSKLEHIPIKKRILLRDSAMYQHIPSSVEELNQQVDSSPISQNSNLPGSPFVGKHWGPNSFSKHQADNLKSLQSNDNSRETVAKNIEGADSHPLFSGSQTPIDVIINNADKDPIADAVLRCTKGELSSVSLFPVAKGDVIIAERTGAVVSLAGNVTVNSYSGEKASLQQDDVACMDLEAVQSITQDNRIFWDLNVEMDAWEKPANLLTVESETDPITSDVQSDSNLERSEDYRLKWDTAVSENETENYGHPMVESTNSDDICEQEQKTSDSSYGEHTEQCGSVSVDQQLPFGSCHVEAHSTAKSSMEMTSMTRSCNQELASKTNEHLTSRLDESTANFFECAPRRDPESVCATPNNSVLSTEEQNFDNKNIIIDGEGSVNFLHISDREDKDNDLSKKWTDSKAGQHVVTLSSSADKLERRASARESDQVVTPEEKVIAENIKAASSTGELTETPLKRVDIDRGNRLLSSFREECDVSIVQSVSTSAMCHQDATSVKQVPSMDKDCWVQIEQDYEDGELREMDMHCWDENETLSGEIECLDYEPEIEDIDELDESQTSVDESETGFKSKKCNLSETQLEKKLSGCDQLPKDGLSSAHETQGVFSRTLRSELRSCSDMPTHFVDAEDKETVVERRIRPKDMVDSYPAHCGSGFDKFNGKRRSTPHIHGKNRAGDWDSEHRSSVNSQYIYDSHSRSRRMNINSQCREQYRSRSPYHRNEAHGPHTSYYSGYSRGRNGSRVEGSGRSLRVARNGYMGSLADDRSESELCMRPEFQRRERRSFSPRPAAHFSGTFIRSRSRSRTRSPPLWVPRPEHLGPMIHHQSSRTRLPFWKSNYPLDSEMRCNSPPRSRYVQPNLDLRQVPRDRSPVRSFGHKENFDTSYSRGSFKSSEDFRPTGCRGRVREVTPDRVRGCIDGKDRRKHEDRSEPGLRKHYYKR